ERDAKEALPRVGCGEGRRRLGEARPDQRSEREQYAKEQKQEQESDVRRAVLPTQFGVIIENLDRRAQQPEHADEPAQQPPQRAAARKIGREEKARGADS